MKGSSDEIEGDVAATARIDLRVVLYAGNAVLVIWQDVGALRDVVGSLDRRTLLGGTLLVSLSDILPEAQAVHAYLHTRDLGNSDQDTKEIPTYRLR